MSVDKLQERIRKLKAPLAVDLTFSPEEVPPQYIREQEDISVAYAAYLRDLLAGLNKTVAAVKFDLGAYALMGGNGLELLSELLALAKKLGYYVLLAGAEPLSALAAEQSARTLFSSDSAWCFDGLILTSYIGSDGLQPYVDRVGESGKALFVVARTANRSAPETQDLLTGSRLAHIAKVDIVSRFTEPFVGKYGYSQVAVMAAASSADSLKSLRSKYRSLFLLLDGCDYPNANAKNCSYAFDRLGHGAIACAGRSVSSAWRENHAPENCVEAALAAAERLKKNLLRYITIL